VLCALAAWFKPEMELEPHRDTKWLHVALAIMTEGKSLAVQSSYITFNVHEPTNVLIGFHFSLSRSHSRSQARACWFAARRTAQPPASSSAEASKPWRAAWPTQTEDASAPP